MCLQEATFYVRAREESGQKSLECFGAPSMGIALEVFVRRDELHDIHVFAAVRRTMREQRKRRVVGAGWLSKRC